MHICDSSERKLFRSYSLSESEIKTGIKHCIHTCICYWPLHFEFIIFEFRSEIVSSIQVLRCEAWLVPDVIRRAGTDWGGSSLTNFTI
jgi:hypothetical protein